MSWFGVKIPEVLVMLFDWEVLPNEKETLSPLSIGPSVYRKETLASESMKPTHSGGLDSAVSRSPRELGKETLSRACCDSLWPK